MVASLLFLVFLTCHLPPIIILNAARPPYNCRLLVRQHGTAHKRYHVPCNLGFFYGPCNKRREGVGYIRRVCRVPIRGIFWPASNKIGCRPANRPEFMVCGVCRFFSANYRMCRMPSASLLRPLLFLRLTASYGMHWLLCTTKAQEDYMQSTYNQ